MRKTATLFVAGLLVMAALALAEDRTITGTVTRIDSSAKSMSVKDASGSELTVSWDNATKLDSGLPQEGSTVTVTFDGKDQGTRPVAKAIAVQQPKKPY
jgi:hypothetical protein